MYSVLNRYCYSRGGPGKATPEAGLGSLAGAKAPPGAGPENCWRGEAPLSGGEEPGPPAPTSNMRKYIKSYIIQEQGWSGFKNPTSAYDKCLMARWRENFSRHAWFQDCSPVFMKYPFTRAKSNLLSQERFTQQKETLSCLWYGINK